MAHIPASAGRCSRCMAKHSALRILGHGSISRAAETLGVSYQAVWKWPDILPARIADRVLAVLARKHLPPELMQGLDTAPASEAHPKAA